MTAPRTPHPSRLAPCLVGTLLGALALAGCGSDAGPAAAPPPSVAASPVQPSAAPSPSAVTPSRPPVKRAPADPLTGRTRVPSGSVVAVKIDNSPLARPYHRGLGEASVVYQELVEGGASRFLAVYAPATATEVGPVRSVRESDLELLQQYGRVVLGSSGGNAGVLATLAQAARAGRVLDGSYDVLPGPYRRAERRADAYNFFTSPQRLDRARPGGQPVRDVGLRFGPLPPTAGTAAPRAGVSFSPRSRVRVVYDAGSGAYSVFQDGSRMPGYAPANVVVQHVRIQQSRYVDVSGNRTPYTTTLGSGPATVLRDGRRLSGTWRRGAAATGTRFLDAKGRDLPLRPGATLVLLVPADRPLVVG